MNPNSHGTYAQPQIIASTAAIVNTLYNLGGQLSDDKDKRLAQLWDESTIIRTHMQQIMERIQSEKGS